MRKPGIIKRYWLRRRWRQDEMNRLAGLQRAVDLGVKGTLSGFHQFSDFDSDWADFAKKHADAINELRYRRQKALLEKAYFAGIDIPEVHIETDGKSSRYRTLTDSGQTWLRREVRKYQMNLAKDWVAIVSPVLSAVIAILGLIVAMLKK